MAHYSTVDDVIEFTGIRPGDLGLEDDPQGTTDPESAESKMRILIESWLVQVKDLIDQNRNRDFHEEEDGVPPGIHNIALRVCANMVAQAVLRRDTPIVRVDDFNVRTVEDRVITSAIKDDLKQYARGSLRGSVFRMFVISRAEEI